MPPAMLNMLPKFELVPIITYFMMLPNVRRPSSTPRCSTPEVLIEQDQVGGLACATSTAPATEMPTSAACSDGASLMPSPM